MLKISSISTLFLLVGISTAYANPLLGSFTLHVQAGKSAMNHSETSSSQPYRIICKVNSLPWATSKIIKGSISLTISGQASGTINNQYNMYSWHDVTPQAARDGSNFLQINVLSTPDLISKQNGKKFKSVDLTCLYALQN